MTSTLLGLRVENYKRLGIVDIEFPPEGGVIAVMGANEAGKTSLLDALESTIAGRKAPKATKPVKAGADKARIVATFDDIIVERIYRANGTTAITVKAVDGRPVGRAEELLNKLYSHVALDPLAFSKLSDKDQVDTLLPLIGFDPAPLDAERKEAFDLRTIKGREVDTLKAQVESLPVIPSSVPASEVSVAELSATLETALAHNTARESVETAIESARSAIESAEEIVKRAESALRDAKANVTDYQNQLADRKKRFAEFSPAVDVDGIRQQIAGAEDINRQIRARAQRAEKEAALKKATEERTDLTARIDAAIAAKADALGKAAANMPVPGLSVEGDETPIITLNGIPFSDASTGVKIRTGTAIAMALNPDLRLIVIRDASLLDQGNRAVIDELAKQNEFLVLMEIADENSPVGVVIEDGSVREIRTAGDWEA